MYVSSQKLRLQILLNALTQPGFLSTFTCIYCQRVDLANVVISDTAQAMSSDAPLTCCVNLLFVRGSQTEQSSSKEREALKGSSLFQAEDEIRDCTNAQYDAY